VVSATALILFVVEPTTFFKFALWSLNDGGLVAIADDEHLPRVDIDFPTLDRVVHIAFEDDLCVIFEVCIHLPVAVRPEHTGELGVAVGEREVERRTVLVKVNDFANTADAVEGRRVLDDRRNLLVRL